MIVSNHSQLSELMFHNNAVPSPRQGYMAMVTKIYKFHNVSPILAILQKGRNTVE